jgi:hypothetical protein
VLKEVRENIAGCGKDSLVFFFGNNRPVERIYENQIHYLEKANDGFEDIFRDIFHYATDLENPHNPTPDNSHLREGIIGIRERQETALKEYRAECLYWQTHNE